MCCCCSKNQSPVCLAVMGLISSILSLCFLIWSISKVYFEKKAFKTLYIVSDILLGVCAILFIILIIFAYIKQSILNTIGKILCILISIISNVVALFVLIVFIKVMKDYYDVESILPGRQIPTEEYCAAIIPFIICLACVSLIEVAACGLMKHLNNNANPPIMPIPQNTMVTQPGIFPNNNIQQPGLLPNNYIQQPGLLPNNNIQQPGIIPNNNGPSLPIANTEYQSVVVKQNENNNNN